MAGVDRAAQFGIDGTRQVNMDTGFGNIIVVVNIPIVPKEKFEKLASVMKKIYNQLGVIKENGLWMPVDPETEKTLGYCFIEFNTPQEAQHAKEKTHGYKLDRCHIFAVTMLEDFNDFGRLRNENVAWKIRVMKWKKLHQKEKFERQNLRDGEISDEEEDEYHDAKDVEFEDPIDVSEETVSFN